jgi:hypothetical protein
MQLEADVSDDEGAARGERGEETSGEEGEADSEVINLRN